jgi:hypothetical protein
MINNKYIDKAKEVFNKYIWPNKGLFLTLLIIIITGVFKHWYSRSSGHSIPHKDTIKATNENTDKVTSTGTITVTPNKEPNDVLVVHESLVASNGHRKVEVPIRNIKAPIIVDNPSTPANPDNNKNVTYENKIDVSALVRPLVPKWEIGTGVGTHRGDVYVPVSVQRDYKVDKAVRVEVHLDPKDRMAPKGVEVQHIWKF